MHFVHNWMNKLLSEENLAHCLKLERWPGPPHKNKVKQYEMVLFFKVGHENKFVYSVLFRRNGSFSSDLKCLSPKLQSEPWTVLISANAAAVINTSVEINFSSWLQLIFKCENLLLFIFIHNGKWKEFMFWGKKEKGKRSIWSQTEWLINPEINHR